MKTRLFLLLIVLVGGGQCWDQEELDVFDLVEEIGIEENFYHIMGVEQSASAGEIKRAYRQLSLKLHPDKSDDPDAADKFRKLVAVSEVLKDEQKREWYDRVLVEGLPDWKQPLYYYRRVRKMGLLEMSALVLLFATVGHYLYGWAVYLEKQLVLQELLTRKEKKIRKTNKKSTRSVPTQLEAELEYHTAQANASIPSLRTLLPILLLKSCLSLAKFSWGKYLEWKKTIHLKQQDDSEQESDKESEEEEEEKHVRRRSGRRTNQNQLRQNQKDQVDTRESTKVDATSEELYENGSYEDQLNAVMSDLDDDVHTTKPRKIATRQSSKNKTLGGGVSGTEARGIGGSDAVENIGASSRRASEQPLNISKSKHESLARNESSSGEQCRPPLPEADALPSDNWSQFQQTQLEWALSHYPKFSEDRWENVSKAVPGKTVEECVKRCKELFEAVRKRKVDSGS